jgi:hypothetical protein
MESVGGQVNKLTHTFPVIVLFGSLNSIRASSIVLDGQNASAGGMDDPQRVLGGVMLRAFCDGLSCSNMITVGEVCIRL